MARLADGDDLALNTIMDRWSERVSAFLYRMTGSRDVSLDLTQETFVKLYQGCKRYRPTGAFSTYLFAVAANLARNHAKWKTRHPTVSLDAPRDETDHNCLDAVDPSKDPEEAAAAVERICAVEKALFTLPEELREAMSLFIYEGMGYSDIAELAGCSPKAVETRIYRARQILKEQLKDIR